MTVIHVRTLAGLLAAILAAGPWGLAGQQSVPDCQGPVSAEVWLTCGFQAAGEGALLEPLRPGVTRELRFVSWWTLGIPARAVIVRESQHGVEGRELLIWYEDQPEDEFFQSRCRNRMANAVAVACDPRTDRPVDWPALLSTLDSIGTPQLPVDPIAAHCPPRAALDSLPPLPAGQRYLFDCIYQADGIWSRLEYRTTDRYWFKDLDRVAHDTTTTARDRAVMRAFGAALREGS